MITEQCKIFIDEALTAADNSSKLSAEASAHLETCIECRRSLESIKALKASAVSILPAVSLTLKSKIAQKLGTAMKARELSSIDTTVKTVSSVGTTGAIIACLGLSGLIVGGAILSLDTNKSFASKDNVFKNKENIESIATQSKDLSVVTNSIKNNKEENQEDILQENEEAYEDMRDYTPKKHPVESIPSVTTD